MMKIKPLMLSEDEIEKGFDISTEYPVDKVNVSGDYVAYDIWYHVTNDKGNELWIMDIYDNNVIVDDKLTRLLDLINYTVEQNEDVPFKFNYDIFLDG